VKLQNLGLAYWTEEKSGEGIPSPSSTPDHRLDDDDDVKTLPEKQCHSYYAVNPISEAALILPTLVRRGEQETVKEKEHLTPRMNENSTPLKGKNFACFTSNWRSVQDSSN
jgi:hypothetical protein